MKKYIAPTCELMNLASEQMLAVSFNLNTDKTTTSQLSNSLENLDSDWED